jgi:hypothetical protein
MSNVIELKPKEDGTGYLMDDNKKITGVYSGNIGAFTDYDNVYVGAKTEDGLDDTVLTNVKDMNEFCLMWLLIFNPDVIKE